MVELFTPYGSDPSLHYIVEVHLCTPWFLFIFALYGSVQSYNYNASLKFIFTLHYSGSSYTTWLRSIKKWSDLSMPMIGSTSRLLIDLTMEVHNVSTDNKPMKFACCLKPVILVWQYVGVLISLWNVF